MMNEKRLLMSKDSSGLTDDDRNPSPPERYESWTRARLKKGGEFTSEPAKKVAEKILTRCMNCDYVGQHIFWSYWRVKIYLDGYGASYSFRRNCPLKKLMDEYCNQYDLDVSRVGFLFDGRLVQAEQTPHELGIEDGDEMLVMLHLRRHV
ncbi:unnamed protein product [Trifolium pratense]|uniref:Uncharacterized protein n=1 Tax=Trifolium pratense TaxID=57577 RepID=A0ACB0K218_TRIPR|nr:unnamed protein product [Trifolium pratense]